MSGRRRFPLRPQPLPEEALSSWVERLAAALGVRNEEVLVAGLDMPSLTDDQLDYQPPAALITRLSERTTVAEETIRAMTVQGYVPLLIDRLEASRDLMRTYAGPYWFFIPPEGRRSQRSQEVVPWQESAPRRGRTCPLCLRHDAQPYRRLYWRLSWMGSCPSHGVLLDEHPRSLWERYGEEAPPATAGHADLLFLDGLTLQAITTGAVVLPNGRRLHGRSWLRMVRAVIDELCLPIQAAKQASATLRVFWAAHDLAYRERVRLPIPFEMYRPDRQRLLLTVAGSAIRMLCEGQVVPRSPWALLLAPAVPQGALVSVPAHDGGTLHRVRDAPLPFGALFQQWIDLCRTDPVSAAYARQWLLANTRGQPNPAGYVDHLLAEVGIPRITTVTDAPTPPL